VKKNINKEQEFLIKHRFLDFRQTFEFLDNPLNLTKDKGLYDWEMEGKRYFDAIGGILVATLEHRHPRAIAAIKKQLEQLTFFPPLHWLSDFALDFIKKLDALPQITDSY